MKFLADEGIDKSIVEGLRSQKFDVYYVIEEIRALDDDVLLRIAQEQNRVVITKDKDFGELVFHQNKTHAGVILVRLEGYSTKERAEIVCPLISQYLTQLSNAFVVIQKGFIRIRKSR